MAAELEWRVERQRYARGHWEAPGSALKLAGLDSYAAASLGWTRRLVSTGFVMIFVVDNTLFNRA